MAELTYDKFLTALVVILLLAGAYNTIMTAWRNHREEKRLRYSPVTKLQERLDRHEELLKKDKDRLDAMENRMQDMGQQSTIMLRGVRALLSHEINGNSDDKLMASMSEIDDYLIGRK